MFIKFFWSHESLNNRNIFELLVYYARIIDKKYNFTSVVLYTNQVYLSKCPSYIGRNRCQQHHQTTFHGEH